MGGGGISSSWIVLHRQGTIQKQNEVVRAAVDGRSGALIYFDFEGRSPLQLGLLIEVLNDEQMISAIVTNRLYDVDCDFSTGRNRTLVLAGNQGGRRIKIKIHT
jgi:hypothetical protein